MKKLIIALLSIPVICAAAPTLVTLTLAWNDTNNIPVLTSYVPTTNDCYVLIGTNNAAAPISTWPVLAVYTNWTLTTNGGKIFYNSQVSVPKDNWFFAIVTSNFWDQATPSNVAQTGPASTPAVGLNLSR